MEQVIRALNTIRPKRSLLLSVMVMAPSLSSGHCLTHINPVKTGALSRYCPRCLSSPLLSFLVPLLNPY